MGKFLFNKDFDRKIYEFICLNTNKEFEVEVIPKKGLSPKKKKALLEVIESLVILILLNIAIFLKMIIIFISF